MIQALLEYGRREGLATAPGYGNESVRWILDFSREGDRLIDLTAADPDGKGTKTFRNIPRLSAEEKKGKFLAGRAADFLLAPMGEIFGLDDKGNEDPGKAARSQFFRECLVEASEHMPILAAIADALAKPETLAKVRQRASESKLKWTDKATIRIGAHFPIESEDWKPWWQAFRARLAGPASPSEGTMVSFATGELVVPESVHEKFRGWGAIGGSSFGEPLIAFDKEAFASYGLRQGENAAMEADAVAAYAGALRHLIERKVFIGGSYFAAWYIGPSFLVKVIDADVDNALRMLNIEVSKEAEPVDPHVANLRLKAAMERIKTAGATLGGLDDLRFCVLCLSVAPGRVMIRDYYEGSVLALEKAAEKWFQDLEIVDALNRPAWIESLATLTEAPLRPRSKDTDFAKWIAPTAGWARPLVRSALTDTPIPRNVFDRALDAHRRFVVSEGLHDLVTQKGELTVAARLAARRLALIKAFLLRQDIPMTPALDPENPSPAYHCGRLLALYDGLQRAALGDVGAGVIQRFYAGATTNPSLVFARLSKLAVVHLDKLEPGLAHWFEDQIAEVHEGIKGSYPGVLDPHEQALFALGFWHQLAARNRRMADAKAKKAGGVASSSDDPTA